MMAEKSMTIDLFHGFSRRVRAGFFRSVRRAGLRVVVATLLGFLASAAPLHAQTLSIAAVVNEDAISVYDLNVRITMLIATSNLDNTQEVRRRLAPQVLRGLIDEHLELQEAKRLKINVTKDEINVALAQIERQNNFKPGALDQLLQRIGVPKSTLIERTKAEIAWSKVVRDRVLPQIQIGPEEIDAAVRDIRANATRPEYLTAEIVLPTGPQGTKDSDARQLAVRIVQELKRGANFQMLAQNFSQSPSAARGGDMGWVKAGNVDPKISAALEKMKPGQVTEPIRAEDGYHIILLRKKRLGSGIKIPEPKLKISQFYLPLPASASAVAVSQTAQKARALTQNAKSCTQFDALGRQSGSSLSGNLGAVKPSSLPVALQSVVSSLPINHPSAPVRTKEGVVVLMVCERSGQDTMAAMRAEVRRRLFAERADNGARRLLRDLRRRAFVDVRL
ncbi:periplasmic chaperone for outer membrane proteins SurA [Varunaivibrio sulfuroxidans]|uniref:Parvulin-like PPIase n=2 Tax=Varunaivibrio sulfuroxidans TaxID=1773489 RepID=A0A4R3J478_9PROT|nr:periplasmic chaperone for outer membrane proteins SurA [Varunaivibrio sulfuroxidans]